VDDLAHGGSEASFGKVKTIGVQNAKRRFLRPHCLSLVRFTGCGQYAGMISLVLLRRIRPAACLLSCGLLFPGAGARNASADTPPPAPVSAEAASFDAVTARLDRGGSFYLYLSAAQWLSDLSQKVLEWRDLALAANTPPAESNRERITQGFNLAAALIRQSGLEQITGVGASSLAIAPGVYRSTFFVHHDKGAEKGFLDTLFGSGPHTLTGLDFLPADTAAANFGDWDVPRLIGAVRETLEQSGIPELKKGVDDGLAQFASVTGMSLDDLLGSLGGSADRSVPGSGAEANHPGAAPGPAHRSKG
jgi:hypothetical protein